MTADLDLTEAVEMAFDETFTQRVVVENCGGTGGILWDLIAAAVAAAAPIIAAQVRESASAEILARKIPVPSNNLGLIANDALILAARIAREGK